MTEISQLAFLHRPVAIFASEVNVAMRPLADSEELGQDEAVDTLASYHLPGYQPPHFIHRRQISCKASGGGICVWVREGTPFDVRSLPTLEALDPQSDFMECHLFPPGSTTPVPLHFIYRPPDTKAFPLSHFLTDDLTLFGDLNAHCALWSAGTENAMGKALAAWCEEHGLMVVNNRKLVTRLTARDGASSPDVLVASAKSPVIPG
jgi:hypothetical protein